MICGITTPRKARSAGKLAKATTQLASVQEEVKGREMQRVKEKHREEKKEEFNAAAYSYVVPELW